MSLRHTQFDAAITRAAEEALDGLTEVQRVHFALKIMMDATSPDTVSALSWAAGRVDEHANILMRKSFEWECG